MKIFVCCSVTEDSRRIAVLIDGDFINPTNFGRVLAEAARCGEVVIRRIYGSPVKLSDWKEDIKRHEIEPVPTHASGKNIADVTLIINAVEILHSEKWINGFCIVTNDNDFAGLVIWLRKKGAFVEVIWSSDPVKHKPSFKDKCDKFKHIDELPESGDLDDGT